MKFWIQSFLLGVPKIIVGFRTRDGILVHVQEIETHTIPHTVNSRPGARWNADMCVNFADKFLECTYFSFFGSIVDASRCGLLDEAHDGMFLVSLPRASPLSSLKLSILSLLCHIAFAFFQVAVSNISLTLVW